MCPAGRRAGRAVVRVLAYGQRPAARGERPGVETDVARAAAASVCGQLQSNLPIADHRCGRAQQMTVMTGARLCQGEVTHREQDRSPRRGPDPRHVAMAAHPAGAELGGDRSPRRLSTRVTPNGDSRGLVRCRCVDPVAQPTKPIPRIGHDCHPRSCQWLSGAGPSCPSIRTSIHAARPASHHCHGVDCQRGLPHPRRHWRSPSRRR